MDAVPHRWGRPLAALAGLGFAWAGTAAFGACSLQSSGLVVLDAASTAPSPDATTGAPDASAPDAPHGDGCASVESNCLDGLDDDCNGLIDCADPACTPAFTCVPAAEAGFQGFAIYAPDRANPCPSTYPVQTDTFESLFFLPAMCSACTCAAGEPSCGAATLVCAPGAACVADGGTTTSLGPGCNALDGGVVLGAGMSCELDGPAATPGTCTAEGGTPTFAPASFGELSRICAASAGPGGGCAAGSVCVADAPAGSHGACVSLATDDSAQCPAGYPNAHATVADAASFTDTRTCTSCGCTGPTGAACAGSANLEPGTACGGAGPQSDAAPPIALSVDAGCVALPETVVSATFTSIVSSRGACSPAGGEPTGGVTPRSQTLYCCQN